MQPANPTANAAANPATNAAANAQPTLPPTLRAMLLTPKQTQPQGKTLEPNLHQCKLTTLKEVSVDV
jgi:hypothetical protein